jgi:hypothetical protein
MDDRMLARWRLHTLRLAGRSYPSPEAVIEGLLGVQAENYAQASWAVAARTTGVTEEAFGRLYDQGAILRTHVLRPTWHFVRPDDIRWLVELTAPRTRRSAAQLQRHLGLGDRVLQASAAVIAEALSGGAHLTREALGDGLRAAHLPADGLALGTVLFHAEASALICSGARRDGRHTYALLDERAPKARRLDRDEALAELVVRYFTGHGPATERDLAYWASMTLTDVRAGLAAAAGRLDRLEHDGRTYWFAEPPPPDGVLEPRAHLLQTLDEYHNGYQDSRSVLDVDGILPRGRSAAVGMALVDGQMIGDMRRTVRPRGVGFEVGLFRPLAADEAGALQAAAHRYGTFLGLEASLATTDRSGR